MSHEDPQPLAADTGRMLQIGVAVWSVALVVTLAVPTLHQGERHWWPWTCLAGLLGGGLALLYVRQRRAKSARAHLPAPSPRPADDPPPGR